MDNANDYLAFREALHSIFSTPKGELVKKALIKLYVEPTALADTSDKTHYLLGQKELIQGLIKDSENLITEQDLSLTGGNE